MFFPDVDAVWAGAITVLCKRCRKRFVCVEPCPAVESYAGAGWYHPRERLHKGTGPNEGETFMVGHEWDYHQVADNSLVAARGLWRDGKTADEIAELLQWSRGYCNGLVARFEAEREKWIKKAG